MKPLIILSTIMLFASCGQQSTNNETKDSGTIESKVTNDSLAVGVALQFINSYVDNCNKMKESMEVVEWANATPLVTDRFRKELKKAVDQGFKDEPELGLEADPIFDAQDYPDKGFELDSFDSKTNFVVVKGKDWADFKLTVKLALEKGNWLVDGCGIINIPADKRIKK